MEDTGHTELKDALSRGRVQDIAAWLDGRAAHDIAEEFTRLDSVQSALVWRLLNRDRALEVFEELDTREQQELLNGMRDQAFRDVLELMDPDDRARMLGEAPAVFVHRVLQGLSPKERAMTSSLLGFPEGSVGRVMSPEVVTVQESTPVPEILKVVKRKGRAAETIDVLAVVERRHDKLKMCARRCRYDDRVRLTIGQHLVKLAGDEFWSHRKPLSSGPVYVEEKSDIY
jgi:magnesium transporter